MPTGQGLVDKARTFLGERYSTAYGRDDVSSGFKDCSGLIAAAYELETGDRLGANISVTIYDLCVKIGLWVPYEMAYGIAGAVLLCPEDPYIGWGPLGHIGLSDGKGGTVEATPPRVQALSIHYQPWGSNACLLPGIDYTNAGQGGAPAAVDTPEGDSMLLVRNTDLPEESPDNWFLFTGLGHSSPVDHDTVLHMAAQGVTHVALSGGEVFALAVHHAKAKDDFINRMKELGVGGSTVVERPVLVPADPTSLSTSSLLSELGRRLG